MKHVWPAIALAAIGGVLPLLASEALRREFVSPPDSARPGVYWYFLDGNRNRLIGDQLPENKNVRELKWAEGYLKGQALKTGRYTYTPCSLYNNPDWPLSPSGLIGPVCLMESE